MFKDKNWHEKTVVQPRKCRLRRERQVSCTLWMCSCILCNVETELKIRQLLSSALARRRQHYFRILGTQFEQLEVFEVFVLLCLLQPQTAVDHAESPCQFWVRFFQLILSFCIRILDRQGLTRPLFLSWIFVARGGNHIWGKIPLFVTPLSVFDSLYMVSFKPFLI